MKPQNGKTQYLPKAVIQKLSRRSDLMGWVLVLHCWGTILAAALLFIIWPNPLTFLIAVIIIGARQLGLAILMHEAAHGILFKTPSLNKWIGQYALAFPVGADLPAYRQYHLKHHKYTQTKDDPDLPLSAPFPITRAGLYRKIVRDLTGLTGLRLRGGQLIMALKSSAETDIAQAFNVKSLIGPYITNLIMFFACYFTGYGWVYFALWLVPLFTVFQLVVRVRNIAEHAMTQEHDPLKHARTTTANIIERIIVAPYWVNYHAEHHLYMYVPCWQLKSMHSAMMDAGHVDNMETAPSYLRVLSLAAPRS